METKHLYLLAASLAIGFLIGLERGWKAREAKEGTRIAGVRTFTLIALLGGATGLLTRQLGQYTLGLIFLGFAALIISSYVINLKRQEDVGITSIVAALLTFILGSMATLGYVAESASVAIVATLFLRIKTTLHDWIKRLERKELLATLELLLISVVLLNILPNQGYGPWQAFNPFEICWMVVLVASVSYVGYFAVKIAGARKGIFFTGLFTGFVSSTILTFYFSRFAKQQNTYSNLFAMGILIACGLMFFRVLLFVLILNPALFLNILIPMSVMGTWLIIMAGIYAYITPSYTLETEESIIKNPLELKSALLFGATLSVGMVLVKGVNITVGAEGLYVLSALAGMVDVDAITLPLSRLGVPVSVNPSIAISMVIAACANTFLKAALALIFGGKMMFKRVSLPLLGAIVLGAVMTLIVF